MDGPYDDLFLKFDLTTKGWSTVKATGTPPSPRGVHCACVVGDRMVLFGGYF
jgi:hypothetical protein